MGTHVFGPDTHVYLANKSLTDFTRAVAIDYNADALDGTAIGDSTRVNVGGLKGWTMSIEGIYSPDATEAAMWARVGGTQGLVTIWPEGAAGSVAYFGSAMAASLQEFGAIGEATPFNLSLAARNSSTDQALIRGTPVYNSNASTSGAGGAFQLGAVGADQKIYIGAHVTSLTGGTSPTVTFRIESDDNSGFTSATTQATASSLSGAGAVLHKASGAISDTYWRVAWTTTGSPTLVQAKVSMGII